MVESRSSSESEAGPDSAARRTERRCRLFSAALLALTLVSGCVTVKPEDKEFLAEPAMIFGSGGESQAQEEHVMSNREGSFGAGSASGGGCGCN